MVKLSYISIILAVITLLSCSEDSINYKKNIYPIEFLSLESLKNISPKDSSESAKIISLKQSFANLDYNKALEEINEIMLSNDKNYNLIFEAIRIKNNILNLSFADSKKMQNNIEQLEDIKWNSSLVNQYKYIHFLNMYSDICIRNNNHYSALTYLHYALYLLESTKDLIHERADIHAAIGSILLNERGQNVLLTADFHLNKAIELYKSQNLNEKATITLINKSNISIDYERELENKHILDSIYQIKDSFSPLVHSYIIINKGFSHYINNEHHRAIDIYKEGLSILESKCHKFNFDFNCYIAESYLELNQINKANFYLSEAKSKIECNSSFELLSAFYTSNIKHKINTTLYQKDIDSIINPILERRSAAIKLFKNKAEFHLGDFFAQNTSILTSSLIEKNIPIPANHQKTIRHLFNDTKKRNIKLNNFISDINEQTYYDNKTTNTIFSKYLKCINYFLDTTDFTNNCYKELFKIVHNEQKRQNVFPLLAEEMSLSNDKNILHYLKFHDKYYYYLLTNGKFELGEIEIDDVNKILNFIDKIAKRREISSIDSLLILGSRIIPNPGVLVSDLIIVPDGDLEFIPFDILIGNPSIKISYDILDRSRLDSFVINKNNFTAFSFSDHRTLNSSKVKQITELYHGYSESKKLSELFSGRIIAGVKCTKENFKNHLISSDIIHISTHGITNKKDRDSNFLIFRDNQKLDSLFSNEIRSMNINTKFISLAACDTNTGQHIDGSGVFAISKACLEANTNSVLKTFWKIDDQVSEKLILNFYNSWFKGNSINDALYEAKNKFRDSTEYSHPYYWAGFALEGNPNLYLN